MNTFFKAPTTTLVATLALLGGVGASVAAVTLGDTLGTSKEDIRSALTAKGYTVEEVEAENGKLEAEVTLDGQEMEIVIDATSGTILELEMDDDDKDEKDDD